MPFPGVLWLWHFLYSAGPHPVSSLHIYTFVVSRAFMAGAASQAVDADSSRAPGLTSGLQGSVNVHRGALLLVPVTVHQFFVFYYLKQNAKYFLLQLGDKYHKLPKMFGNVFNLNNCWSLVQIRFKNTFKRNLYSKPRRPFVTMTLISSGSNIVNYHRIRQFGSLIIERSVGLAHSSSSVLYRQNSKHCTLTNKAMGTGLSPNLLRGDKAMTLVPSSC